MFGINIDHRNNLILELNIQKYNLLTKTIENIEKKQTNLNNDKVIIDDISINSDHEDVIDRNEIIISKQNDIDKITNLLNRNKFFEKITTSQTHIVKPNIKYYKNKAIFEGVKFKFNKNVRFSFIESILNFFCFCCIKDYAKRMKKTNKVDKNKFSNFLLNLNSKNLLISQLSSISLSLV